MPSRGVFGYAAINARVRAMIAYLLSTQDWAELINAPDFPTLIGTLRRTVYGPYLTQVDERDLTPRRAVYQIKSQMADVFNIILRVAPAQTCPLLTQLYRDFEVDNLKAVLRGILAGSSWDQIRHVLFPLGKAGILPAQAMVETGSIASAIELLKGTPYYSTLAHAMQRYNVEQSLFPLEVALDLYYWRTMWEEINRLPKDDKEHALKIIGAILDMNNLMWAIRFRVYYHLSEEEIINYTLPFGYRVRDSDIRAIAAGADIPQVINRVYPNLPDISVYLMEPRRGLPQMETQLQKQVYEECRRALIGYPFHIGVPLAFLVMKEMEVQDLTVLIEAKSSNTNPDDYRPLLVLTAPPR